ncbi:hypothetical protein LCGC14_2953410, partial [marine sediment metagenome]
VRTISRMVRVIDFVTSDKEEPEEGEDDGKNK